MLKHPSDLVGLNHYLLWDSLFIGIEYEFELVSYFKAKPISFGNGGYIDFAAVVLKDVPESGLMKDEMLRINFPYKTFVNSLWELPRSFKLISSRENLGEENLVVKIIKKSKTRMHITYMEKKICPQELKDKADEIVYSYKNKWGEVDGML